MAAKDPMLAKLGERLRTHRKEHGWSQEELAFKCGMHRTYIGAVERGEYNLTVLTLHKVTAILGISMSEVLEGLPKRRRKRR